jgi:hypothetical protein
MPTEPRWEYEPSGGWRISLDERPVDATWRLSQTGYRHAELGDELGNNDGARSPNDRDRGSSGSPSAVCNPGNLGRWRDLTKRLAVPLLCHRVQAGKPAEMFAVVGVDQNDGTRLLVRGGRAWCHQR